MTSQTKNEPAGQHVPSETASRKHVESRIDDLRDGLNVLQAEVDEARESQDEDRIRAARAKLEEWQNANAEELRRLEEAASSFDCDPPSTPLPRYRHKETATIVEVSSRADGTVVYFAQGGGFQHRKSQRDFEDEFEAVTQPAPFVRGTVGAEWIDEKGREIALACISNGDRWNGWAMPFFERDQVDLLMTLMPGLRWGDGRTVIGEDPEEDIWESEVVTLADGTQVEVWGVGAGSWTWEDFQTTEEATTEQLDDGPSSPRPA